VGSERSWGEKVSQTSNISDLQTILKKSLSTVSFVLTSPSSPAADPGYELAVRFCCLL
jgi:hypothetical protein